MRVLVYLGPILAFAIIVTALTVLFATLRGPGLDQESHAFVDCAIPAIAATWDEQHLINRATPELLNNEREQLDAQFTRYKQLGRLQSYEGAQGGSDISVDKHGLRISGRYHASARFESGEAALKVALVKRAGDWRINEFRVESPLLLGDAPAGSPAPAASAEAGNAADLDAFGTGIEGFERWGRSTLSAWAFRYQSASEVWIAMSDAYGPYPTEELAARAGAKYLSFVNDTDKVRIVLFRTNEKGAEATVDRSS